jgi:hypothetical protein
VGRELLITTADNGKHKHVLFRIKTIIITYQWINAEHFKGYLSIIISILRLGAINPSSGYRACVTSPLFGQGKIIFCFLMVICNSLLLLISLPINVINCIKFYVNCSALTGALYIRKTADLPLQLCVDTFPCFVAIRFYFLSETLI